VTAPFKYKAGPTSDDFVIADALGGTTVVRLGDGHARLGRGDIEILVAELAARHGSLACVVLPDDVATAAACAAIGRMSWRINGGKPAIMLDHDVAAEGYGVQALSAQDAMSDAATLLALARKLAEPEVQLRASLADFLAAVLKIADGGDQLADALLARFDVRPKQG